MATLQEQHRFTRTAQSEKKHESASNLQERVNGTSTIRRPAIEKATRAV